MDDARLGRAIRVLRQRRRWRQVDLAARAALSDSAVSDIERGHADRYTLRTIRSLLRTLDAGAQISVRWGAPGDLDRLMDADHAAVALAWAELHRRSGWEVWPEASFSIYGERGRIDLLAFHQSTSVLVVAECKTGIWDVGDTLGRLDAKIRLAPQVAEQRGWRAGRVVGALVVSEGRTARRRVEEHELLFARYDARGRAARAFLRDPSRSVTGLLAFVSIPRGRRRAGQRRVEASSVGPAPERHALAAGQSRD